MRAKGAQLIFFYDCPMLQLENFRHQRVVGLCLPALIEFHASRSVGLNHTTEPVNL